MTDSTVIEKIRKLLAMAQDERGNEFERENALRQAHALLTKHSLDLNDIEEKARDAADPRIRYTEAGWNLKWAIQIRGAIGRLFMCDYFYGAKINGTKCHHNFIGRESNAITAAYMSAYVIESVLKEGRKLFKHNLDPKTRAFAWGVAIQLQLRIAEMIKAKEQEVAGTGKGLALVDIRTSEMSANEDYMHDAGIKLKFGKARDLNLSNTGDAYSKGSDFAKNINLSVQVSKPSTRALGAF